MPGPPLGDRLPRPDLPELAAQTLRQQILSGQLRPGTTLPAERELALTFGINRATVREALSQLERAGLLTRRQGSRAIVNDFHHTGTLDLLADLTQARPPGSPGRRYVERSVRELVRAIYTETARLAAERRTPTDLTALRSALHDMNTALADGDQQRFGQAQHGFITAVATATGSVAFELATNTIIQGTTAAARDQPGPTGHGEPVLAFYRTLLNAIDARRPRQAAGLVRAALTNQPPNNGPHQP